MTKLGSLRGLGAVVTGASSGIGRALALRLASDGARVVLVARRAALLDALAEEIRASGGEAHAIGCDVADREAALSCAAAAEAHLGAVDVLVTAAGYGGHRAFLDWDLDDIERMLRVNYFGSLYFARALTPSMAARRRGHVVFIASVAGRIGSPEESAYAASKFALVGLAEALSIELEAHGVHVLTVCPGVIDTPFFDAETRRRLPPVARRGMRPVGPLVDAIMNALARGRHTLTYPRSIAAGYVVRALAPGFFRRQLARSTIGARARERQGSDT